MWLYRNGDRTNAPGVGGWVDGGQTTGSPLDKQQMHILFVCQANRCRSAMAEAMARKLAAERDFPAGITFRSAGLWTQPGWDALPEAKALGATYGADMEGHETTPFGFEVASRADYVVTMTRSQKAEVLLRLPSLRSSTYTLAEFAREITGRAPRWRDVQDPVGGSRQDYEQCARALHDVLVAILDVLSGKVEPQRGLLQGIFGRR